MTHLDALEHRSVHILREAYANFRQLCMLWSIGKDSTVLLWLARKAFFGHVPFPLVHVDTSYKIPEMIAYRDRLVAEWGLNLLYGQHQEALAAGRTFPLGAVELALWFTAPAQLSEWTLFSQDSAFAGGGHGLAHGVFYNSGGEVSAVALQNALMRHR